MSKKHIIVTKDDGTSEEMEVVLLTKLENSGKQIIFYKSNINNQFFVSAFNKNNDDIALNVDFTEQEKEQIQKLFDSLVERGIVNG